MFSHDEDSNSDDSIVPGNVLKEKIRLVHLKSQMWKTKYFKTKEKFISLKRRFQKIQNLNIQLQEKVLQHLSNCESQNSDEISITSVTSVKASISEKTSSQNQSESDDSHALNSSSIVQPNHVNVSSPVEDNQENVTAVETSISVIQRSAVLNEDSTEIRDIQKESDASNSSLQPSSLDEPLLITVKLEKDSHDSNEQIFIPDEALKAVTARVKPGEIGDSVFVKNLAVALYGNEELSKSSVTGTRCLSKKDVEAKPALSPRRMCVIKSLLTDRIQTENPSVSIKEVERRVKKTRSYVAEKIATLNRAKRKFD